MNFKGHLISSAIVAAAIPITAELLKMPLTTETIKVVIPAVILGGNLADVDTESKPSKYYAMMLMFLSFYWAYIGTTEYILIPLVPFLAAKISKHRGFTHSRWIPNLLLTIPLILEAIIFYGPFNLNHKLDTLVKYEPVFFSFGAGMLCHLLMDSKFVLRIRKHLSGR